MTAIEKILVEESLERPPHAFDVVVAIRDVRIAVVEPESDSLAELLPVGTVLPYALATAPIEFLYSDLFDLLLATDAELFFYFDLDWQAMCVPSGFS